MLEHTGLYREWTYDRWLGSPTGSVYIHLHMEQPIFWAVGTLLFWKSHCCTCVNFGSHDSSLWNGIFFPKTPWQCDFCRAMVWPCFPTSGGFRVILFIPLSNSQIYISQSHLEISIEGRHWAVRQHAPPFLNKQIWAFPKLVITKRLDKENGWIKDSGLFIDFI